MLISYFKIFIGRGKDRPYAPNVYIGANTQNSVDNANKLKDERVKVITVGMGKKKI